MIVTNEDFDCGNLLADLSAQGLPADAKVIYRGRNVVAEVRGPASRDGPRSTVSEEIPPSRSGLTLIYFILKTGPLVLTLR